MYATVQQANGTNMQPYSLLVNTSTDAYVVSHSYIPGLDNNMVVPSILPPEKSVPDVNKGIENQTGPNNFGGIKTSHKEKGIGGFGGGSEGLNGSPDPAKYPARVQDGATGNALFNDRLVHDDILGYNNPVSSIMRPRNIRQKGAPLDYGPGTGRTRSTHTPEWYAATREFGQMYARRFTGDSGSMAGLSQQGRVVAPGGQIRRFREMSTPIAPPLVNTLGAPQATDYPALIPFVANQDGGVKWW